MDPRSTRKGRTMARRVMELRQAREADELGRQTRTPQESPQGVQVMHTWRRPASSSTAPRRSPAYVGDGTRPPTPDAPPGTEPITGTSGSVHSRDDCPRCVVLAWGRAFALGAC